MSEELLRQIEFLRDIGVQSLDVMPPAKVRATAPLPESVIMPVVPSEVEPMDNAAKLLAIREEIGDCQRCKLAPTRTNIVFGSGNPNAELVFVGEAPGFEEDRQGLPFVGRAGQLLTRRRIHLQYSQMPATRES
jgi:DNA polymerase